MITTPLLIAGLLLGAMTPEALLPVIFPPLKTAGALANAGKDLGQEETDAPQLKMARGFLQERDEAIAEAAEIVGSLHQVFDQVGKSDSKDATARTRKQMTTLGGEPLDTLRLALNKAVKAEKKRVALLKKALETASAEVADLDPALVDALDEWLRSPEAKKSVDGRIRAYRSIIEGLSRFLDGDNAAAMMKMKAATEDADDIAIAHMYLGSFLYLMQDVKGAASEWQKVLELEPKNETVRQALRERLGKNL